MAAKDIKDRESLERWLSGRPIEDARVIASRVALRAVPALETAGQRLGVVDWAPRLLLAAFRAHAVARSAAKYPERATGLRNAASASANAASVNAVAYAAAAARRGAVNAFYAAEAAVEAAASYAAADRAFAAADRAFAAAAEAAFNAAVYTASAADIWTTVRADAEALENGASPSDLASSVIWPEGAPAWATEWQSLTSVLRARPVEHWDVWIDWYEARLRGEPGNEEEEIARVLEVTEEEWAAGPAVANKKIKDIVARFKSAPAAPNPRAAPKAPTFISHAAQADGARASALTRDLEAAGLPCWVAPRDIPSGADWNAAIVSAIDACEVMILLVSDAALKSPFVKAEVQHAFEKGKRVFPIRLADSIEAGQIDLRLKIVQHIDGRSEAHAIVASILKSLG